MPLSLGWQDVALRLALAVIAGTLIGANRTERGRPVGLRTVLLVCIAATVSMIQTNLLLATAGRPNDSFIMMDLMRLPLGILTGMGFIGGGAILRRGDLVVGVTTAATLWLVTVVGLAFGGGQLGLGIAATALGIAVLWGFKWVESAMHQDKYGTLTVTAAPDGPGEEELRSRALAEGLRVVSCDVVHRRRDEKRISTIQCHVCWRGTSSETRTPACVSTLAGHTGVLQVRWKT
jgi:putative Mg2+ transporter-C (MgtC) family protein